MTVRSEYEVWKAEIEKPKLSIAERVARWFDRPAAEADTDPDVYRWWTLDELLERQS